MNEKNMIETIEFIEKIRERFNNENITALNLKYYRINANNEFLQQWLENNKDDFELINNEIRKTTKIDRLLKLRRDIINFKDELKENKKRIEFLIKRNEQIYEQLGDTSIEYEKEVQQNVH